MEYKMTKKTIISLISLLLLSGKPLFCDSKTSLTYLFKSKPNRFTILLPSNWTEIKKKPFIKVLVEKPSTFSSRLYIEVTLFSPEPSFDEIQNSIHEFKKMIRLQPEGRLNSHSISRLRGMRIISTEAQYTRYLPQGSVSIKKVNHIIYTKGHQYVLTGLFPLAAWKKNISHLKTMLHSFTCTDSYQKPHDSVFNPILISIPFFILLFIVFLLMKKRKK